jgi:AcrR family transcriptional regulator
MARRRPTTPRKEPSQTRSKETVEVLLAATARVLQRDGYDRASTNRIAAEAGVSIGSLYQYFPGKEALVAALIEREVDAQYRVVADKLGEVMDAPLPMAVRKLVEAVIGAHRHHPKLHKVLTEEVPRVGALRRIVEIEAKLSELMRAGLQVRRREIRPENLDLAAFVLVHAVDGVVHGAVNYAPERIDDGELVDELTELLVNYLAK